MSFVYYLLFTNINNINNFFNRLKNIHILQKVDENIFSNLNWNQKRPLSYGKNLVLSNKTIKKETLIKNVEKVNNNYIIKLFFGHTHPSKMPGLYKSLINLAEKINVNTKKIIENNYIYHKHNKQSNIKDDNDILSLKNNKNIIILNADKNMGIVIASKTLYIDIINNELNNFIKIKYLEENCINTKHNIILNNFYIYVLNTIEYLESDECLFNLKKHLIKIYKVTLDKLKEYLLNSDNNNKNNRYFNYEWNNKKYVESTPEIYGMPKIHKLPKKEFRIIYPFKNCVLGNQR